MPMNGDIRLWDAIGAEGFFRHSDDEQVMIVIYAGIALFLISLCIAVCFIKLLVSSRSKAKHKVD